jgi:hypothetical protein
MHLILLTCQVETQYLLPLPRQGLCIIQAVAPCAQVILLPQPPEQLGLQPCTTMPTAHYLLLGSYSLGCIFHSLFKCCYSNKERG